MKPSTATILHIADLHLGCEASIDRFREIRARIIDLCRSGPLDLILVAGDLFDNSRLKDGLIRESVRILLEPGPPVVLLPGNHDCYEENSPYRRIDARDRPNGRLHLLTADQGQDFTLGRIHVWGKPVIVHDEENRPLANISKPREDLWNVALAHGHVHQGEAPCPYSSLIRPAEIGASGYDYIALGHWHFACEVSCGNVRAHYSGSPFGPVLDGTRGTGLLVTLDSEKGTVVETVFF